MEDSEYERLRAKVIAKFGVLFKDSLAMDLCEVPKDVRVRMLEDEAYLTKTKALRASLFAQQLETLDEVIAGSFAGSSEGDRSSVIIRALEMKQKLLLEDLNVGTDDSNALNVAFVPMSREEFESSGTVEAFLPEERGELGADFGQAAAEGSFEERVKADAAARLKELDAEGGE